jgi:predicted polyphosphate/ATP-dependent NAD kinase
VIVNPIAGMGGRVGLKGTDGEDRLRQAIALGAEPTAATRAVRALAAIRRSGLDLEVFTAPGEMGSAACQTAQLERVVIGRPEPAATSAADTAAAAISLVEEDVDLLLFAGGDGTARDVYGAIGDSVPILGVPTGVKMHSGVFARNPEAAGEAAAVFLRSAARPVEAAELVDAEPAADGEPPRVKVYGEVKVPAGRSSPLPAKARSSVSSTAAVAALCRQLADGMDPRRLYIIGPGATAGLVKQRLGIAGSIAAVDAVVGGRLVAADAGERELLALLDRHVEATVIAGVIGGQGYLFGRGNQQISAAVLARRTDLVVVSSEEKLLVLKPQRLLVDTGDPEVDRGLGGYCHVGVAPGKTISIAVSS